jgi:hypothetical protein
MAIRASNLALGDLVLNASPRIPATGEEANYGTLLSRVDVIELEHQWIALAAVNTWVFYQELPETARRASTASANQLRVPCDVRPAIQAVVLAAVDSEALTTN